MPGKNACPPKTFGYFNTAYIEISPPMELPAVKVFFESLSVLYFLSIKGFNVFTKKSTYLPPSPTFDLLLAAIPFNEKS
jgi:hypothetical protein